MVRRIELTPALREKKNMVKRIPLTEAIQNRLRIVRFAKEFIGCDHDSITYGQWESLKLELADELIAEIERCESRPARLTGLPRAEPAAIVELRLTPKRSRRA